MFIIYLCLSFKYIFLYLHFAQYWKPEAITACQNDNSHTHTTHTQTCTPQLNKKAEDNKRAS